MGQYNQKPFIKNLGVGSSATGSAGIRHPVHVPRVQGCSKKNSVPEVPDQHYDNDEDDDDDFTCKDHPVMMIMVMMMIMTSCRCRIPFKIALRHETTLCGETTVSGALGMRGRAWSQLKNT